MSSTIRGSYDVIVEELASDFDSRLKVIATLYDCGIDPS